MHIKKFLHYSFITVPDIFLFFRKLRNYRRIRIFAMQKRYVRVLIFALLSVFLEDEQFIPLLLNVLQPNMRTRVCTVINNNIAHELDISPNRQRAVDESKPVKEKIARRRDFIFTVAY